MTGFQIWCDGNCLHEETGFDVEYLDELYDEAKDYCEGIIEAQKADPDCKELNEMSDFLCKFFSTDDGLYGEEEELTADEL